MPNIMSLDCSHIIACRAVRHICHSITKAMARLALTAQVETWAAMRAGNVKVERVNVDVRELMIATAMVAAARGREIGLVEHGKGVHVDWAGRRLRRVLGVEGLGG